jgi:thiamine pyrophosphokinase
MSSHHIIRDNQEPALILIEPLPWEQLSALLEWSPSIYVHTDLVEWIESMRIKVDVFFGNISKKTEILERMAYQQPIAFIECEKSEWPSLIPQIKNGTIHVSVNWENISVPKDKTIIFFSPIEKTYLVQKTWQKWLNKNDSIKIVQGESSLLENLTTTDVINYIAIDNGLCKIECHSNLWLSEPIA